MYFFGFYTDYENENKNKQIKTLMKPKLTQKKCLDYLRNLSFKKRNKYKKTREKVIPVLGNDTTRSIIEIE